MLNASDDDEFFKFVWKTLSMPLGFLFETINIGVILSSVGCINSTKKYSVRNWGDIKKRLCGYFGFQIGWPTLEQRQAEIYGSSIPAKT